MASSFLVLTPTTAKCHEIVQMDSSYAKSPAKYAADTRQSIQIKMPSTLTKFIVESTYCNLSARVPNSQVASCQSSVCRSRRTIHCFTYPTEH